MTDNTDFTTMDERNEQTLTDIKNLQQIEQDLYNTLETNATNNTLTEDEKTKIINKINEVSQMRINLYANLRDNYGFFQKNVSNSRMTLDEQIVALDIIENELSEAKLRLRLYEDEKYNKLRQVEINTYYGKKYNSHTDVMKIIVIMCIPILIIGIIHNSQIIDDRITYTLMVLTVSIGVIAIGYKLYDNALRDNMNYDEYDWGFNEKDAPTDNSGIIINPWELPNIECRGPACCIDGVDTYDNSQNKCVPNDVYNSNAYQYSNSGSTTSYQSFANMNVTGNVLGDSFQSNTAAACEAACTSNSDCGGFVYDNSRQCNLKDSSVTSQSGYAESGFNFYLKNVNNSTTDTTTTTTTETFRNNNSNLNKLNYSLY